MSETKNDTEARAKRAERTKTQRDYKRAFYRQTGFPFLDDETRPFRERAEWNIRWIRQHIEDAAQRMERLLDEIEPTND